MPIAILGMPLFVDYYTIHDPIEGTIKYAPHNASTKTNLLTTKLSTDKLIKIQSGVDTDQINKAAVWIAWGLVIIIAYVAIDYWARVMLEDWNDSYSETLVLTFSILYVLGVLLAGIFILHPFLLWLVRLVFPANKASYVVGSSVAGSLSFFEIACIATVGFFVLRYYIASTRKAAVAKKATKAKKVNNDAKDHISELLAQALAEDSNRLE